MALAFGSLQIILDKGQQDDWFSSPLIVVFTMVMVICMVGTVVWEWAHPNPIVNVRLFLNRNFATSAALMFTLGAVLYGSTVLIPQFVQTLMGYSAERAGMVLSPGGFTTMAMMPLVGFLVSRVPAKYLITLGFAGLSLSLWHMTSINLGIDPHTATMYRVYQAASLAFLFVPINTVAYIGVPREQNNQVSGLMNLARNIGGSVGISFFVTTLARSSQRYQNQPGGPAVLLEPGAARSAGAAAADLLLGGAGGGAAAGVRGDLHHRPAAGGVALVHPDHRGPGGGHRDLRPADPALPQEEPAGRWAGRRALSPGRASLAGSPVPARDRGSSARPVLTQPRYTASSASRSSGRSGRGSVATLILGR